MPLTTDSGRRVVWSDFAGVLTAPLEQTMAVFCGRIEIPEPVLRGAIAAVTKNYRTPDFMMPLDTPLVTEAEWLRQVAARLPEKYASRVPRTTIADLWFDGREPNDGWVRYLRRLRERGCFVGLLSNMMPSWDAYWRRMVPVDELFDDVILSFAVGARKPQRRIYGLATRRAGAEPGDCVFVDDQIDNVRAARQFGWTAVHFTDTAAAIAQVDAVLGARHRAAARTSESRAL